MSRHTLNSLTGRDVALFIENQLGQPLPKSGFLAGQAVTSVVLYLLGKARNVDINDYDIFVNSHRISSTINVYDHHMMLQGQSLKLNDLRGENLSISRMESAVASYQNATGKNLGSATSIIHGISNDIDYGALNFDAGGRHILRRIVQLHEGRLKPHERIILQEELSRHKNTKLRGALRREGILKNRKQYLDFMLLRDPNKKYSIVSTFRDGDINTVNINIPSYFDRTKDILRNQQLNILKGFDLNANQVGVCLKTHHLIFTHEFNIFCHSLQMKIVNLTRPWHSIVRYVMKKERHGYYGNDDCEIGKALTHYALKNGVGIHESINHGDDLHGRINGIHHNSLKGSNQNPLLGKEYFEKLMSLDIKNMFSWKKLEVPITTKDKLTVKIPLHQLIPNDIPDSDLINGIDKQRLESASGMPIYRYSSYAIANIIPHFDTVHSLGSRKKYIRADQTLNKISINKKSYESIPALHTHIIKSSPEAKGHINEGEIASYFDFCNTHPEAIRIAINTPTHLLKDLFLRMRKMSKHNPFLLFEMFGFSDAISYEDIISKSDDELNKIVEALTDSSVDKLREKIFENYKTDRFLIEEVVSNRLLYRLGMEQNHCVYSYRHAVKEYKSSIFLITDTKTKKKSMAECALIPIRKDHDTLLYDLSLRQHRGKRNRRPGEELEQAFYIWYSNEKKRVSDALSPPEKTVR